MTKQLHPNTTSLLTTLSGRGSVPALEVYAKMELGAIAVGNVTRPAVRWGLINRIGGYRGQRLEYQITDKGEQALIAERERQKKQREAKKPPGLSATELNTRFVGVLGALAHGPRGITGIARALAWPNARVESTLAAANSLPANPLVRKLSRNAWALTAAGARWVERHAPAALTAEPELEPADDPMEELDVRPRYDRNDLAYRLESFYAGIEALREDQCEQHNRRLRLLERQQERRDLKAAKRDWIAAGGRDAWRASRGRDRVRAGAA